MENGDDIYWGRNSAETNQSISQSINQSVSQFIRIATDNAGELQTLETKK